MNELILGEIPDQSAAIAAALTPDCISPATAAIIATALFALFAIAAYDAFTLAMGPRT